MKRRIISIITALALCWSLCPTWAFAYEGEWEPDTGTDTGLCAHHTEHTDDCGYIAPGEGQPCGHAHTDDCYITGEDGSEVLDCQHTHDSECGYIQADPGASCGYECPLCPIEALIAALPRALTEDNAETVRWQLDEILDLWRELSEDEQGQIDMTLCSDLLAALDEANAPAPVEKDVPYQVASWNESTREVIYSPQTADNCTPVTDSTETVTWDTGWYVVTGTVTISQPITVNGAVNLILADDCTLNAAQGIVVTENNSLSIYAQSDGSGTGMLNATGVASDDDNVSAGIGGGTETGTFDSGDITIHGGTINATGGSTVLLGIGGAGIGGGSSYSGEGGNSGTIKIYGGTVNAKSGEGFATGAGIGGGASNSDGGAGSSVIIYGGNIIATSTGTSTQAGGAGIGGGTGQTGNGGIGSSIMICGGIVKATSGPFGAGIGGGGGIKSGAGTNITISGGEVTAIGGRFAAGIGGGGGYSNIIGGTGTDIHITGGIVDAKGGAGNSSGYAGDPIGNGGNATGDAGVTRTAGIIFEGGVGKVARFVRCG